MERLIRALYRVNKEAHRIVSEMADDAYDEFNATESEDDEDVGSAAPVTSRAMQFMPELYEEEEEDWEDDELPLFMQACNWGVPHYIWDATRVALQREGVYTSSKHEETVFTWTHLKSKGRTSTPWHYAVCADSNLQRSLLETSVNGNAMPLLQAVLEGENYEHLEGLREIRTKGKHWLLIDWEVIGRKLVGIEDDEALALFVKERTHAMQVGVCDVALVNEVDKRYKRGVLLDLSIYE